MKVGSCCNWLTAAFSVALFSYSYEVQCLLKVGDFWTVQMAVSF